MFDDMIQFKPEKKKMRHTPKTEAIKTARNVLAIRGAPNSMIVSCLEMVWPFVNENDPLKADVECKALVDECRKRLMVNNNNPWLPICMAPIGKRIEVRLKDEETCFHAAVATQEEGKLFRTWKEGGDEIETPKLWREIV